MKKLYIILALVVVSILMVFAGDTLKILRVYHNGTYTAIPLANIDSIDHSRFDANGKLQPNYASIIETLDSTYNIPISEIDSVVVTEDDYIDIITDDIAHAINKINPYFLKCESTAELSSYIDQFLSEEYIDEVWYDETTFFVKTKDGNTFTFTYPPLPLNETTNEQESRMLSRRAQDIAEGHEHLENMKNVYLVNQTYNDEQFDFTSDIIESMRQDFTDCGFEARIINSPSFSFFLNDIRYCDILYLQTHGCYNKEYDLHWIFTGDEVYTLEIDEEVTDDIKKEIADVYNYVVNGKRYSRQHVNVGCVKEKRRNGYKSVCYIKISELFIRDNMPPLNKTIIFNTACQSLKEDEVKEGKEVAKYFIEKGACCYLGYTETNNIGHYAAREFFRNLLNGKSIGISYNNLDSKYVNNKSAKLDYYPNESSNCCIIRPQTNTFRILKESYEYKVQFIGEVTLYYPITAGNQYGFCFSENQDMSDKIILPPMTIGDEDCSFSGNKVTFRQTHGSQINGINLNSNVNYYFCAYLFDGHDYCYSTPMPFYYIKKDNICPDEAHPHKIDLGLPSGTLWWCCNVGANAPEDYGTYFAFGDTRYKDAFEWSNYKYKTDSPYPQRIYSIEGFENEAYGHEQFMPNYRQFKELQAYCSDAILTVLNGVNGLLLTGPNGAKLFLPAAGMNMSTFVYDEDGKIVYNDDGKPRVNKYISSKDLEGYYWLYSTDFQCIPLRARFGSLHSDSYRNKTQSGFTIDDFSIINADLWYGHSVRAIYMEE